MLPRFSMLPRYERSVIGGWQFNSVFRAYNGLLQNNVANVAQLSDPTQNLSSGSIIGANVSGNHINTCYENSSGVLQVTGVNIGPNVPGCASASSTPAFELNPSFTLNTVGPRMESVRTKVHPLADASIFKKFPIHERVNFEIRGEFFNVFNTANFGGPGTSPASTSYGVVTLNEANDARIGQITARINF